VTSISSKKLQVQAETQITYPALGLLNGFLFLVSGTIFGIVAYKSEIISWYRIQEMFRFLFRFQSFHMYGVIASAVVVGALSIWLLKKTGAKTLFGDDISIMPKSPTVTGNLLGGTIFGFGWAMTGACPGPLYALVGSGSSIFLAVILSALLGVWVYGSVRRYLPH